MISNWIAQVKVNYPDMPVFTRARASTSYRILKALVEKQGYHITSDERENDNWELFHHVVMEAR